MNRDELQTEFEKAFRAQPECKDAPMRRLDDLPGLYEYAPYNAQFDAFAWGFALRQRTDIEEVAERIVRNLRMTQCEGKEAFESAEIAKMVSKRINQNREAKTMPYVCPNCGIWHVGTNVRKKKIRFRPGGR